MGEAGPEAIMPLKRGANGKLGVQAEGGGGTTVIQNNTFGSGVTRAEVNAMLPKMVEATKAAVADAKLRGGSYGGAFA
jgi:phage-related minor tail protein